LGLKLGQRLGRLLGVLLGLRLGQRLGRLLGLLLGLRLGQRLGRLLGLKLGQRLGRLLGLRLGQRLGLLLGLKLGQRLGWGLGWEWGGGGGGAERKLDRQHTSWQHVRKNPSGRDGRPPGVNTSMGPECPFVQHPAFARASREPGRTRWASTLLTQC
jgi:hypothetical protein